MSAHHSSRRRTLILARAPIAVVSGLAAAAVLTPAAALAADAAGTVRSASDKVLGSKPVTLRWHTDRAPREGRRYRIQFRVANRGNAACRSFSEARIETWRKGKTVTVVLRPRNGAAKGWWCTGTATARVFATSGGTTTVLAKSYFEIKNDPKSPTPLEPVGTPVRIDLLAGSAIAVQVPGRPERTGALTGTIRGFLPGKFKPNTDLQLTLTSGSISLAALPPDPLCTASGRAYPTSIALPPESSSEGSYTSLLTLTAPGSGYMTLVLGEDPLALTGCQGPAPVATRPIALVGKAGPTGLVNFTMTGSLGGVTLSDGAVATLSFTFVVKIDLSGK